MKKVGIGCAIVGGVMVIALVVAGMWAARTAKDYLEGYAELSKIPELNEQVANQSPYQAPADGRLTARQVEQYVSVQQSIREELGRRFRALEEKYDRLSETVEAEGRDANVREILQAWSDIVALVMDAKRAQVDALNETNLSLQEYHWIRTQTLMALGYGAIGFDLEALAEDPSNVLNAAQQADTPDMEAMQHNRALLTDYEESMEDWIALGFFGL